MTAMITLPLVGAKVNYFTKVSPNARTYAGPFPAEIVTVGSKYNVGLKLLNDNDKPTGGKTEKTESVDREAVAPGMPSRTNMNDDGSLQHRNDAGYGTEISTIDSVNKREAATGQEHYWDYVDGTVAAPPWDRAGLNEIDPVKTGSLGDSAVQVERATLGANATRRAEKTGDAKVELRDTVKEEQAAGKAALSGDTPPKADTMPDQPASDQKPANQQAVPGDTSSDNAKVKPRMTTRGTKTKAKAKPAKR
jgi:hypothetical protein